MQESGGPMNGAERRTAVRLAGGDHVDATAVDPHGQPVCVLEDARVLNLAAGGMALTTTTACEPGQQVRVVIDATGPGQAVTLALEALEQTPYPGGRYRIRCRLIEGEMPARLIHGWAGPAAA